MEYPCGGEETNFGRGCDQSGFTLVRPVQEEGLNDEVYRGQEDNPFLRLFGWSLLFVGNAPCTSRSPPSGNLPSGKTCRKGGRPARRRWSPQSSPLWAASLVSYTSQCRGVAQPGSAPAWGAGGRQFKSGRPDQQKAIPISHPLLGGFSFGKPAGISPGDFGRPLDATVPSVSGT